MSCSALKTNLSACKNWSMLNSEYCSAHRTMTYEQQKTRWFQRYILGNNLSPLYTIISPFKKDTILKDLLSRRIVLTKEDIQKIPAKEAYVDIYLLLLEHNFAKYGDHPKLERIGLWLYQVILHNFPFEDRNIFQRNKLFALKQALETHLILASGLSLYRFLEFIGMAMIGRKKLMKQMRDFIPTILDSQAAKELSWFSYDELDKIRKEWVELSKDHPMMKCLTERWLPDLKELYHTEKMIQKAKMDHCKEELMMNRWHPDRVEKLLLAGIDVEDM